MFFVYLFFIIGFLFVSYRYIKKFFHERDWIDKVKELVSENNDHEIK
jgi:hypothetical protein